MKTLEEIKESKRIYAKAWYKDNKERSKANARAWQGRNPNKVQANTKAYREKNRRIAYASTGAHRASKVGVVPTWANTEAMREIYAEAHDLRKSTNINYHVDHIVPLQGEKICGLHVENNLQILTASENISKGNKFEEE